MSWRTCWLKASLTSTEMSSTIINSTTIRCTTIPKNTKCHMLTLWLTCRKSMKNSAKESTKKMSITTSFSMTVKTPPSKIPSTKTSTTSTSSSYPTMKASCLLTHWKTLGPKGKTSFLSRKEQLWNWFYFTKTEFLLTLSIKDKWGWWSLSNLRSSFLNMRIDYLMSL